MNTTHVWIFAAVWVLSLASALAGVDYVLSPHFFLKSGMQLIILVAGLYILFMVYKWELKRAPRGK